MKSRFFTFVMILVHILSVNCRPLAPSVAIFTAITPYQDPQSEQGERMVENENRIGSSPPKCEHKCYGCSPCEATQVPTTNGHVNVSIQYSNYEPEGWKCKCGPTFYAP